MKLRTAVIVFGILGAVATSALVFGICRMATLPLWQGIASALVVGLGIVVATVYQALETA